MKNDAFTDLFYELIGEKYRPGRPWSCFLFHGRYDVPVKGSDKEWLEGSDEVYEYLICPVSSLIGEYEPGTPEFGFLYPAFKERGAALNFVDVFESRPGGPCRELTKWLLEGGSSMKRSWGTAGRNVYRYEIFRILV